MKGMLRLTILEAAIAIALLRLICEPLQAAAQVAPDQPPSVLLAYDAPPGAGSPSSGTGSGAIRYTPPSGDPPSSGGAGGIRGLCGSQGHKPGLRALVPASDGKDLLGHTVKVFWGQTASAHPTLWFDLPYSNTDGVTVEFVLQDPDGKDVDRRDIPLPKTPGVISIQVQDLNKMMQPQQWYQWTLQVQCQGETNKDKNDAVQGWLQFTTINPELMKDIEEAKARKDIRKQAVLYAEHGLWFEALTVLGDDLKANPNHTGNWKALLEGVGLQETASRPMAKL